MLINYITNLDVHQDRGGWDGMNKNVYQQLKPMAAINLVDAINPPINSMERVRSKARLMLSLKSVFPAFSSGRLKAIARQVNDKLVKADLNFFHGSTPWIKINNDVPYACYLDASFATYLSIYHTTGNYEVDEIITQEKDFLRQAKAVFFSSQWSLDQTKKNYSLNGNNFYNARLGGNLIQQPIDRVIKKSRFTFIGLDFKGKGGDQVAEAFRLFSEKKPGYHMTFIGGTPPPEVLKMKGVEYLGYLDKKKEDHLELFKKTLTESAALILPTSRDLTPLVIVEAGYYGCPTIGSRAYGIPEMIGEYGYLCNVPITTGEIVMAMNALAEAPVDGNQIRDFYLHYFTWEATGTLIRSILS